MDTENYQHADIDGGYAWVILVAAFLCHGVGVGSSEIFGIVYVEILDDYQVGKYLTSWIITLQTVFWGLTGIVSGRVIHRFGPKLSIIIGSLLVSGSFIVTAFSTNFYILFLTFGIMAGAAQPFVFVGGASAIYSYFRDKKGLATSIYALGHPTIGMVMSYFMPYLIEQYGYRGAILLVGAVCLNGIPLAMLMRDPSYLTQMSERMEEEENEMSPLMVSQEHIQLAPPVPSELSKTKPTEENEMSPLVPRGISALSPLAGISESPGAHGFPTGRKLIQNGRTTQRDTDKCCSLWDKFGLFLLTDWQFVVILICMCMTNLSHISLNWFIPDRAIEVGLSNHDAAMTITVVNIANILSRLTFGTTSSDNFIGRIVILCVYVFISGLNSICVFLWTTYWTYMLFSGFYGLLRGLFIIYMLLVIVDIVSKDQVSLALGLINTFTGIVFVISIPIFGHLNEVTHSYVMTFILYGSLEIIGGLFLVTIPVYVCWKSFGNERYIPLLP